MKRELKATSLVEVLVVMGIIATTIIGSMVLVAGSLVTVRNNQTEDYVNGILINAIEVSKSPSNLFVNDDSFLQTGGSSVSYFRFTNDGTNAILQRTFDGDLTQCGDQSQYLITNRILDVVPIPGAAPTQQQEENVLFVNPTVCLQVQITPQPVTQSYLMRIKSVYQVQGETFTTTVQSQRYESFKKI